MKYANRAHKLEEQLDEQQKFLLDITAQIEDCITDADFDLGACSVLCWKLKELLETVEKYQEEV